MDEPYESGRPATRDDDGPPLPRMRRGRAGWLAGLLLVAMAGLFVLVRFIPGEGLWLGLLRAGSEAALVGGLADWFAVVALFRHPLGLPIPHTAVIPSNKNRIAENLGQFVERNFLDPELIAARLHAARPAMRLGAWLREPANARWVAERLGETLPLALGALGDREVRRFLRDVLKHEASRLDLGPLFGRALQLLRDSDQHQVMFDHMLGTAHGYLSDRRDKVLEIVAAKSAWWVPRTVDRHVAEKLTDGIIDLLRDLGDRQHPVRRRFDAVVADLNTRLEHDPELAARISAWRDRLLDDERVEAYLQRFVTELERRTRSDLARTDSPLISALCQAIVSFGHALERDQAMCARLDERLIAGARSLVIPWRRQIGRFITDVVRGWDSDTIADRLERSVGRDLQYIRVNGTLVGAIVGCLLYLLSEVAFRAPLL
jgi:uncharacterized membrane-anchored protein YjiN (DUF445 family)